MSADWQSVGVADLRIDAENPRHPKAANDRDAIQALLGDDRGKLVRLAASIAKHGLNPTDVFLILKERGQPTNGGTEAAGKPWHRG